MIILLKFIQPVLNINLPHIRSKSLSKKKSSKTYNKKCYWEKTKKNERLEKLDNSERSDNYEFYEKNELSFKVERIF